MTAKEMFQPMEAWVEENRTDRAIIAIVFDKGFEHSNGEKGAISMSLNGKRGNLISALTEALPQNDKLLADLLKNALHRLSLEEKLIEILNITIDSKDD